MDSHNCAIKRRIPRPILRIARKAKRLSKKYVTRDRSIPSFGSQLVISNIYRNPDLIGLLESGAHQSGDSDLSVYTHMHCVSTVVPHWSRIGAFALNVTGINEQIDTHLAVGGRQGDGTFRLGLKPGGTYTFSASLKLDAPLTGRLAGTRLSVAPGWTIGGENVWHSAVSTPAPNVAGVHRVSASFTIPEGATDAWVRLVCGMSRGGGSVTWADFQLVKGDVNESFFQGSTPATPLYSHSWSGTPHQSASTRTYAPKKEIAAQLLGDQLNGDFLKLLRTLSMSHRGLKYVRSAADAETPTAIAVRALCERGLGRNKKAVAELESLPLGVRGAGLYVKDFARELFGSKRYKDCATVLRRVVLDEPEDYMCLYMLGTCLEKTGKVDEGTTFTKQAALLDPELPVAAQKLIGTDPKALFVRRKLLIWAEQNLAEIQNRVQNRVAPSSGLSRTTPIFTYWHQGFDNAPALVKRAHESLLRFHDKDRVHVITEKNLDAYVDIPQLVRQRVGANYTHLSDLIRLNLLNRHGGYWVDATCLFTGSIDDSDPALVNQEFFFFNYSGPRVGTWFFSARQQGYTGLLLEEAMYLWWEREGYLADYFLLHFMFEILYWLDPKVMASWDGERHEHPRKALLLLKSLSEPGSSPVFTQALEDHWVHKLSYKLPDSVHAYESCYSAILRNEHVGTVFKKP